MAQTHELDNLDMNPARLEREWVISIETPVAGVDPVLTALGERIGLVQGAYDNCAFVSSTGQQRFRAREGSHAGEEDSVQSTATAEIRFSIPADITLLKKVFDVTFDTHVQEEPTIRVHEAWGSRSKYLNDKDNPNRYWNRPNAAEIHGSPVGEKHRTQDRGSESKDKVHR